MSDFSSKRDYDLAYLIQQVINRNWLFGVYKGRVEYNQDPLNLGRLKIRIPFIHGEYNDTPLDKIAWAWPAFPPESFKIPEVGDYVWVMFEGGDPHHPVYFGQWYPIHRDPELYGYAKGRRDPENKEDEWYPRDDRVYSSPKGYEKVGPTYPPEVHLAADQDIARERVVVRTPKGANVYISDQDDHEIVEILDRSGQGLRLTAPKDEPRPGDSSRFLESAFETDRFDHGRGKTKVELHGQIRTKISIERTGEGRMVRIGYGPLDIQINEENDLVYVNAQGAVLVLDLKSKSIHLVTDRLAVACDSFDVAAKKISVSGDLEVSGDLRVTGLVTGVDRDSPHNQR